MLLAARKAPRPRPEFRHSSDRPRYLPASSTALFNGETCLAGLAMPVVPPRRGFLDIDRRLRIFFSHEGGWLFRAQRVDNFMPGR